MSPAVSVIVPVYNKKKFIVESLSSALKQTFRDFEVIVVDDASTDGSLDQIGPLAGQNSIVRIFRNDTNRGANYCRNLALREAKGTYVVFLDADDLLSPVCLAGRFDVMSKDPSLDGSVHSMANFKEQPGDTRFRWVPRSRRPLSDFLSHDLPWQTMQPMWKRETLLRAGGFDESFQRLQDVEFHTRLLLDPQLKLKLCAGEPDCFYRIDEARKSFSPYAFFERWITASVQYCDKFRSLVGGTERKRLLGTVFQTYISLLLSRRAGGISEAEFISLQKTLLVQSTYQECSRFKKTLFSMARMYNLFFFRIPGMNRVLKKALIRL